MERSDVVVGFDLGWGFVVHESTQAVRHSTDVVSETCKGTAVWEVRSGGSFVRLEERTLQSSVRTDFDCKIECFFTQDSLLDMGLRGKGFFGHLWIYGLCLAVVVPAMLLVSAQPDFGTYYPFYKLSSRSWFDFICWESIYFCQFFALEMFFRGWILGALRRNFGAGAVFAMAVPYCMIHYGKPYLEANGAIVAGIVLGSLAMRTRSIYAGFLVHITVAFSMDFLSLWRRASLPHHFWG